MSTLECFGLLHETVINATPVVPANCSRKLVSEERRRTVTLPLAFVLVRRPVLARLKRFAQATGLL